MSFWANYLKMNRGEEKDEEEEKKNVINCVPVIWPEVNCPLSLLILFYELDIIFILL